MQKRLLNDDECEVVLSLDQIEWLLELMRNPAPDVETGVRSLNIQQELERGVLLRSFERAKSKANRSNE